MKKTLAIAIAAGLAAPMAVMADTTLYGSLHQSLDMVDTGAASDTVTVSNNKSYLGVKGSEKISDGLKAVYKIEFGPGVADAGGSGIGNRDQYVGLSGNYGTVIAGRASTPYKIVGAKADLFWFSQLGTNRTITGPNIRANNVIAYFSPKMGGFKASVAHVTEGQTGVSNPFAPATDAQNDHATAWSANAFYTAGGLMLGAGYEKHNGASNAPTTNSDNIRLMASYDTGKFKVVGFAENNDDNNGANSETDRYGIGASVKTAKGVVKAQYYTSSPEVAAGAPSEDSSLIALGYDHKLSKRTTIYAQYAAVDNDAAANTRLGQGGRSDNYRGVNAAGSLDAGQDISGISLGIKHDF